MEVVLRQDVDSLGLRGDVVNVARGYARNFLLPRGLAETATPGLKRELERRDAQRARHEAKTVDEARAIAARLEAANLRFDVTAGPTGALFGSVTATNVADRLWEQEKVRVDRRKLQMGTIKRIGRYTVPLEVFADVVAELKLVVAPEGQELPTDEELAALEAAEAAAKAAAEPAPAPEPEPRASETEPAVADAETDAEPRPRPAAQAVADEPDADEPAADEPAAAQPEPDSEPAE